MTSGTLHDMISAAIRLSAPKADHRTDPEAWIRERLKEAIWSKQRQVLESIRDNPYTAVPSCHSAGKSWLGGRAIVWFVDTRPPGESFVISTAPSAAQVSAIMWKEVGKAHRKGKLAGRITVAGYPQWKIHDGPDGLVGYGRKPSDYTDSAFQGIHATEGVLIVVDEANGVSRNLFEQIDTIAANEGSRVLLLGNPTDPSSYFAEACRPGSKYNVIRVDGLRTPLMTADSIVGKLPLMQALMEGEGIPYSTEVVPPILRKALLSPSMVEGWLQDWCGLDPAAVATLTRPEAQVAVTSAARGSAAFTSRVRAEFPAIDTNAVIPLHWVEQAMVRWEDWKAGDPACGIPPEAETPGRRVLGVDVAREGQDKTAVAVRQGLVVQKVLSWHKEDTMQTVARVRPLLDHPQAQAVVDTIGVGAGVFDRLRQLANAQRGDDGQLVPQEIQGSVVQFIASEQSGRTDRTGKFRFRNDRMAAWWNLRELLDPSRGSRVCLPRSTDLLVQLSTPRWWILDGSPTILVETKDELRKRLKRSPDEADAVVMAFWLAGAPSIGEDSPEGQPVAYDDPLADVTGVIDYPTDYDDGLLGGSDGYGADSW